MNFFKNKFKLYIFLTIAGYLALFINVNHYEFRNEESLRTIISYEMDADKSLIQPKFLGEDYFKKPPLFNWFIIASSKIIPWSEFTARFVSILFLGLTLILIYKFAYKLFKNKNVAILSSLIYLTFLDIYFWYGFLAEIDVTLGFFILLMFYFEIFGFLERRTSYIFIYFYSRLFNWYCFFTQRFSCICFLWINLYCFSYLYKKMERVFKSCLVCKHIYSDFNSISLDNENKFSSRLHSETIFRKYD